MNLPRLWERGRRRDALLLPLIGLGQAAALGLGALALRGAFGALHEGRAPEAGQLALLVLAGALGAGLDLLARIRGERLGQAMTRALRRRLFTHLAGMEAEALRRRRLGSLSLRFVGDLSAARLWFGRGLPRLIAGAVVLPLAGGVLWMLDPALALAAGLPLAAALGGMALLALGLRKRQAALRRQRAALAARMTERIAFASELDLLSRTGRELLQLEADGADLDDRAVARVMRVGLIRLLPKLGAAAAGGLILSAGLAPATVAAGLAVTAILVRPMTEFATAWDQHCAWSVARASAQALLAQPSHLRQVAPRGHPVALTLKGLACDLPPGCLLLIRGAAGAGKSQLARQIAGLDRQGAEILYDDDSALPRLGLVTDPALVLQGSLRRALTLGLDPRPSDREIRRIARAFGLSSLVNHGGLDRRLSEAGRSLSQGQGLRLELARLTLMRPDLIVCDTPRLAADPEAADLLRLLRQMTGATLVATFLPQGIIPDRVLDLSRQAAA